MGLRGWRYRRVFSAPPRRGPARIRFCRARPTSGPGMLSAGRYGGRPLRRWLLVVAGFLLLSVLTWQTGRLATPTLWVLAEREAVALANQAIYRALSRSCRQAADDLLDVRWDERGRIQCVQPDTSSLQALAAGVLSDLQEEMARPESWRFRIPLGQLLGSGLWAGWGPGIPVRVIPAGVARIDFRDSFEGAGVNQTRYALYLDVMLACTVAAPFRSKWIETRCSVPVAQAVIVGEVPGGMLYFGSGAAGTPMPGPAVR